MKKTLLLTTTAILLASLLSTDAWALTYQEALESCSDCVGIWSKEISSTTFNEDLNALQHLYNDASGNGNTMQILTPLIDSTQAVSNIHVVYDAYLNKSFVYTCIQGKSCESPSYNAFVFLCEGTCYPSYDDSANLSTLTYLDSTTGRTILGKEEYTYDSEGNLTQKMTYDSNGNLTQRMTYDSDGTTILGTETFAYDSDGNLIKDESVALKIYTAEQAYAATSKGNNNSISIRFK